MKIAPEGYPFIIGPAAFTLIVYLFWGLAASLPFLLLTSFMVYFFRDPERVIPNEPDVLVAPADGKVIVIRETEEGEFLKAPCVMLSIFMSPLNVHVNRMPCDCTVLAVKHKNGKFLSAFKPEASIENESISILLDTQYGKILIRQIAGLVARRAVCRVKEGERPRRGERFGIIKFSSRVDIFIPNTLRPLVKLSQTVKAGETIIASV
jgi:phosphatidylserine decarboxylase